MPRKTDELCHIDKIIGKIISQKRIAKGMSRKQLANPIDITHQQLQKYETGANRITASRLWLISCILQCELTDFFDSEDIAANEVSRPRIALELIRECEKMNEHHKDALVSFVRSLNS